MALEQSDAGGLGKLHPVPKTLAIVVNWNKCDTLDRMLESLLASGPREFDLVVVDNGSTDGSIEMLRGKYPWVEVIQNLENLGGTGGFNRGMTYGLNHPAGYEFFWLLDNDVIVQPGAFEGLMQPMRDDPRVGLVGSTVLLLDDPDHAQEVGALLPWSEGSPVRIAEGKFSALCRPQVFEADYSASCSLLARVAAVRDVGIWDPAFFVMWDDMEWGIRFRRGGWRVVATTESQVRHESFHDRRALIPAVGGYFWSRNAYYTYWRHAPWPWRPFLFYKAFRLALLSADTFRMDDCNHEAWALERAIADFQAGRMGNAPREIFVRAPLQEPRNHLPPGWTRPVRRIALLVRDNAELAARMHGRLRDEFPGASVECVLLCESPEMLRHTLPDSRFAEPATFLHRLILTVDLPRRYDAVAAPFAMHRYFFESFVPLHLRYYGDLSWVAKRRGFGRTMAHLARRLWIAVRASWLTVRALLRRPWPVDYHDFSEPRPHREFESRDGSHWGERGGFGAPPSTARRVWKTLTHAAMLPFAALTVAAVLVALPVLGLLDRARTRR